MYRNIFSALLICAAVFTTAAAEQSGKLSANAVWSDDFSRPQKSGIPAKWKKEGSKWGVPETVCRVVNGVLQIKCDKSTGGIIINPRINLKKYPVMRWRWRVLSLPVEGDGRNAKKDDQPVGIYVGTSDGMLKKKSIAYRWENLTPQGFEGKTSYAGILTVNYITMRDHRTPNGEWVTEERNVAEDFKRVYGKVPSEFAISIIGNSQYTQSNTVAEVDFIEFLPAK